MRIKKTGSTHTLYRYGGQVDGKTTEIKIAALPAGTKPDQIPVEVLDNLTPKELRELREHLDAEQIIVIRKKLSMLLLDLDVSAGLVTPDILDIELVQKLTSALSKMQASLRRVRRKLITESSI